MIPGFSANYHLNGSWLDTEPRCDALEGKPSCPQFSYVKNVLLLEFCKMIYSSFFSSYSYFCKVEMLPRFSFKNVHYALHGNIVNLGNLLRGFFVYRVKRMYIANILFCKFRVIRPFSFGESSLSRTIQYVFSIGSNKNMIWIHASRVVAAMTCQKSIWNLISIRNHKGYSVGEICSPFCIGEPSIPLFTGASCPSPTVIRPPLSDSYPKPFLNRVVHWCAVYQPVDPLQGQTYV